MGRIRCRWPLWASMLALVGVAILIVALRPSLRGWVERCEQWRRNAPVLAQLSRRAPLTVRGQVTQGAVLADVQRATRSAEFPQGLPIFLDPMTLEDAGVSPTTTVDIGNHPSVPMRWALRSSLRPLGLDFVVVDGRVLVVNPTDAPPGDRSDQPTDEGACMRGGRRQRRGERLTVTDRIATAVAGAIIGFGIWTIFYGCLVLAAPLQKAPPPGQPPLDKFAFMPSYWNGAAGSTVGFALLGVIGGADRLVGVAAWLMVPRRGWFNSRD